MIPCGFAAGLIVSEGPDFPLSPSFKRFEGLLEAAGAAEMMVGLGGRPRLARITFGGDAKMEGDSSMLAFCVFLGRPRPRPFCTAGCGLAGCEYVRLLEPTIFESILY